MVQNKSESKKKSIFIDFIKSAVLEKDFPEATRPEVAITGRSNAGKSSLINSMALRIVAKVSSTPGKTRLLNFFNVNNQYTLVDMPGYGFASRAGGEMESWKSMIEGYLTKRSSLKGFLLVMDIRRDWDEEEEMLKIFSGRINLPMVVVLTKADKLSRSQMQVRVKKVIKDSQLSDVFAVSSLKRTGQNELEEFVFSKWISKRAKS